MKSNITIAGLRLICALIAVPLLISCSNAGLFKNQVEASSSASINFCTTPANAVTTNLKYLFITDQSGSNKQNYTIASPTASPVPDPAGGTDPTGIRRYPSLISFLQNSAQTSNVYYAGLFFSTAPIIPFSNFSGGGASEDTQNTSLWYTGGVQNTASYMATQYQNVYCPGGTMPPCSPQGDGGWTDYIDTLTAIQSAIEADITHEKALVAQGQPLQASSYVIFWVSDGFPYTASGAQSTGTILQQVQDIMNLKTDQSYAQYISSITLNTGFYTTVTASYEQTQAESLMTQMSTIGQGSFVNFGTSTIDYTKFSIPSRNEPFVMRDLWIHNASAVWWNGQLMLDSDNDGIPDAIETQWGSNPYAYDSDGNGIGDGVEYYLWGTPCASILSTNLGKSGQSCTKAGAYKGFVGTVAGCANPAAAPNVYPDTDLDYLNDCEEGLLGSSNTNFDSNQDGVPDQFEWLYNIPFLYGTSGLTANPTSDGVDNYQKLKELFPINTPVSQIHGISPLTYTMSQSSSTATQSCYNVNIQNIATMSNADTLRVYVMESQGVVGSLSHMRVLKNKTLITPNMSISDTDLTQ